jgi:endonuclease YncB( thermonuclease family)
MVAYSHRLSKSLRTVKMRYWKCVLLLAWVIGLTISIASCMAAPVGTTLSGSSNNQSSPKIEARVTKVVDGDTIHVRINGATYKIRYIGIDTAEVGDPCSAEATAANRQLVEGKIVQLEKDVSETDRYGRLLRYVYVGDTMVNAELVRQVYAQVYTYPPDVKYSKRFLDLQRQAREAKRGCWASESSSP